MEYIMTNEETGEVITGTSMEINKKIRIAPSTLNRYSIIGTKFAGCWKIEKAATEAKKSFWQEWMDVTRSLRKHMQKGKNKWKSR